MKDFRTKRLILRHINEGDADDIFEYCKNPIVGLNAGWKPHKSIEETRQIMKALFLENELIFGIILKDSNKLIGTIGFFR